MVKTKGKPKARSMPKRNKSAVKKGKAFKARAARAKPAKAKPAKIWPKQNFVVSHLREQDFDAGLRPYSSYRDLGIAPATGGRAQAHVIRMTKPFDAKQVAIPHYHDIEFQMVYVLKGWFRSEFEGQGAHTFHAGSCWIQPPRIKHTVLGYSEDCELLEIILPADFETVTLEN
jgi:quercetin dioxygenase-like cupin family protein